MKRIPIPVSALLLASAVSAQTFTVNTEGVVGNFARNGRQTGLVFVKSGVRITTPKTVRATVFGASARTLVSLITRGGQGLFVSEVGSVAKSTLAPSPVVGTTMSVLKTKITPSEHCFVLTLLGSAKGKVVISFFGAARSGSKAAALVDIGADRKVEFRQSADGRRHTASFAVTIAGSLKVRVCTLGNAAVPTNGRLSGYGTSLRVTFVKDTPDLPCRITSFGLPCLGMTLKGGDQIVNGNHRFTFVVAKGIPSAPLAFWFGIQPTAIKLPGVDCLFRTVPFVTVTMRADATGGVRRVIAVNGKLTGIAYMQAVSFKMVSPHKSNIRASNGLRIDCGR